MTVTAIYDLLSSFDNLFLWNLPIFEGVWTVAYQWITLTLITLFNFAMLYAIARLAREVELDHIAIKAIRNAIFVGLFAWNPSYAYICCIKI